MPGAGFVVGISGRSAEGAGAGGWEAWEACAGASVGFASVAAEASMAGVCAEAAVGGAGATAPTGSGAERGGVVSLWVSSKKHKMSLVIPTEENENEIDA